MIIALKHQADISDNALFPTQYVIDLVLSVDEELKKICIKCANGFFLLLYF